MTTDPSPDWYTHFFTELPNEFWRRLTPEAATAAEVGFVERHLGLAPGSRVLDVPCGSGRHSMALAARGYRVSGVDISAEAVDHARRAAAEAGLTVDLTVADMRDLPRDGEFDAVVCLGNSFGYLDPTSTRQFARSLAGAVRPGGGLVIDCGTAAESVLPSFDPSPRTLDAGGITVTATNSYDAEGSRLITRYHFADGTRELEVAAVHHVYTSAHLGEVLTEAGFTDITRYAGTDDQPYALGERRLLLTARRGTS
ncbi:SAM-dependent methyltransferase [Streptoalloteichus hindustanus]|uniref:Methyltransferase domain-containing protein n=1 Tax=Streptoalloteichus hindustanus TaxID=2017 RepID=A0A1M5IBA8_STRHI|nr:class I SAM-dependent methyltransferase [Streptoalloteichus hindustanus]SHG25190.1 Methyltransferase domain-containing protein [Streptoalloteichus hindustanus]